MAWVRNPAWDGFWLLGGLPVGLALMFASPVVLWAFFSAAIVLETAHNMSPIVLAWTHAGYRQLMLEQPLKHIALPGALLAICVLIGAVTDLGWTTYKPGWSSFFKLTDWRNPFPVMMWAYWCWQLYHFGMQNYGITRLYRRNTPLGSWHRRRDEMTVCCAVTLIGMWLLPKFAHSQQVALACIGVFSFGHWMQAIGLCSAVSRRTWAFIVAALTLGLLAFTWEWAYSCDFAVSIWRQWPFLHTFELRCPPFLIDRAGISVRDIYVLLGLRTGIGFVHFLYDLWIWRLSDPRVRAAIGLSLS